jgi:hypothetical protein
MPATFTELLPPTKSEPKGAAIDWTPAETNDNPKSLPPAGVLTIKSKRAYTSYVVCEFPADMPGRAFHLAKLTEGTDPTEERYSCFLASNGQDRLCECKGFAYAGHCKHLLAISTLLEAGKL